MDVRHVLTTLLSLAFSKKKLYGISYGATLWIADYLIKNGVTVLEWISVDKELPQKDGKYLVAIKYGSGYSISTRKFKKEPSHWTKGHWSRNTCGVRYWAELPSPPKEG